MENAEIKIYETIGKLLRLSDPNKNSNSHERQVAWNKALEISEKYGVNLLKIDPKLCSVYSYKFDLRISVSGEYPIAGFQYHDGVLYKDDMRLNDKVILKAEPDNKYDKHAVAVYWNQIMIGYIPRERNLDISNYLLSGMIIFGRIMSISDENIGWGEVEIFIEEPG